VNNQISRRFSRIVWGGLLLALAAAWAPARTALAAGVTVSPAAGLVTTEAGGAAVFSVVLDTKPEGNVNIVLSSSNTTEGTVSTDLLTFTASDWDIPQTVTVTGQDDFFDDGDVAYTIIVTMGFTSDEEYADIDPADVSATNQDDDASGLVLTPAAGLATTEGGEQDTFTVSLGSLPAGAVVLDLASTDPSEGMVSPETMTFTSLTWDSPQSATVTGVNDILDDGDRPYSIEVAVDPAMTVDPGYKTLPPVFASATNSDDAPGFSVKPLTGLATTEGLTSVTITVILKTKPAHPVDLEFSSSKPGEGTVSPPSLTVKPGDWPPASPFQFTISGVDDLAADGDKSYQVKIAADSLDPDYASFATPTGEVNLSVTNRDAPTIHWELPVPDEQIYITDDLTPILLRAAASSPEPITLVRFMYWDPEGAVYVTIGEAAAAPYEVTLTDVASLDPDYYTQVFAVAYGPDPDGGGPLLPVASALKRILILRQGALYRAYLPFIR